MVYSKDKVTQEFIRHDEPFVGSIAAREELTVPLASSNLYLEKKNGIVHMRSASLTFATAVAASTTLLTLPVGWRPVSFAIIRGVPNTGAWKISSMNIDPSGDLVNSIAITAGENVVWLDTTWLTED